MILTPAAFAYRALAFLVVLCTAAELAIAQTPTLHLEYIDREFKSTRVGSQPIRVPSTDNISLTVVLTPLPPGAGGIDGERLEVRAENQAAADFNSRRQPNVRFVIRRVDRDASPEVPFKIISSGGGLDLGRLFLFVHLDIVGDLVVRRAKFREYASEIATLKPPPDPAVTALFGGPEAMLDGFARYLEAFGAVYIPPGEYVITAFHTPREGAVTTSEPAYFVVYEAKFPIPDRRSRRELPK